MVPEGFERPTEVEERPGAGPALEGLVGGRHRLAQRRRGAQRLLLGGECFVLVGRDDRRRGDLVGLETQQVELAPALAFVAAEGGELLVAGGDLAAQPPHRLEVDPRELVEGRPLGRRSQQRLVSVLPIEVDEVTPGLLEGGEWRQPSVDGGTGATRARNGPRQDDLGVAGDEATLDRRLDSPAAHDRGVGPSPDEQFERLDDERLAGPGLARDRRQPGTEDDVDVLDHPQLADSQFAEHGRS